MCSQKTEGNIRVWYDKCVEISMFKSFDAKHKFHLYPRGFMDLNPWKFHLYPRGSMDLNPVNFQP